MHVVSYLPPVTVRFQANVVCSIEFSRRYADKGIIFTSLNPGNISSALQRNLPRSQKAIMDALLLYPTPYGALTQLYAGTSPETLDMNGKYFIPWARPKEPHPKHADKKIGDQLWKWLEEKTQPI